MTHPPAIDRALLRSLGDLARLHLPTDREAEIQDRLQRIVAAFDALRQLPTAGVEPLVYPMPLELALRDDRPEPPMATAEVLQNAPRAAAGAFLVPRVVDA